MKDIFWCKNCLNMSTRPRIEFDSKGICNACNWVHEKKKINWSKKIEIFKKLIAENKQNSAYDCIVPWSGGKDSSTIAYKLKFYYGLNPLLVTYAPMIPNKVGQHNRDQLIELGFDHIFFKANKKVLRHLAKRFFIERGNPKVAWDAGINSIPVKIALNFKINHIFYAEHGESEYGGLVLDEESKKKRFKRSDRTPNW